MNIERSDDQAPASVIWEHPAMRSALGRRDLSTVYHRLQSAGFTHRRIAALTGQGPSEVYEILKGRQVMAYEVLTRIADGLGIPRGYMGLSYDAATETTLDLAASAGTTSADEQEEIRALLSHAANVTMGVHVNQMARWWRPVESAQTPVPAHVGDADVAHTEGITGVMRALDYRHGGGACRDAVVAQARWAQQLLLAESTDEVKQRLHLALADLHNLAGWTSFDVGLYSSARRHFSRALEQAKHSEDPSLVANVLYRMGRLHLHQSFFSQALKFFQLGQLAAQDSGDPLTVALLCANEAWAYALMDDRQRALGSLGRAQDEFSRSEPDQAPAWVSFFGVVDLHALMGMVFGLLAKSPTVRTDGDLAEAVAHLEYSLTLRGQGMARSRTFELTALAVAHFNLDDSPHAIERGNEAVDLASQVRSVRTVDRLKPLHDAATARDNDAADALARRIATLRQDDNVEE